MHYLKFNVICHFIHIADVTGAVPPRPSVEWMFLPLVFHKMGMMLICSLRLLHPFRVVCLISSIVHKICSFTTSKDYILPVNLVIVQYVYVRVECKSSVCLEDRSHLILPSAPFLFLLII
jgi:hypothetical protein